MRTEHSSARIERLDADLELVGVFGLDQAREQ